MIILLQIFQLLPPARGGLALIVVHLDLLELLALLSTVTCTSNVPSPAWQVDA